MWRCFRSSVVRRDRHWVLRTRQLRLRSSGVTSSGLTCITSRRPSWSRWSMWRKTCRRRSSRRKIRKRRIRRMRKTERRRRRSQRRMRAAMMSLMAIFSYRRRSQASLPSRLPKQLIRKTRMISRKRVKRGKEARVVSAHASERAHMYRAGAIRLSDDHSLTIF